MSAAAIPVIDLAAFRAGDGRAREEVARAIDRACTDIGFFCITGHGVDEALIAATRAAAAAFFALPEERKLAVKRPPNKVSRGYFPIADRSLAYTLGEAAPPDLQEAWAMGPIDARTAVAHGLINKAVPPAALDAAVDELAATILQKPARVIALGKQAFYRQLEMGLSDAYAYAGRVMASNMMMADAAEGIDAFLDKRPPRWPEG